MQRSSLKSVREVKLILIWIAIVVSIVASTSRVLEIGLQMIISCLVSVKVGDQESSLRQVQLNQEALEVLVRGELFQLLCQYCHSIF